MRTFPSRFFVPAAILLVIVVALVIAGFVLRPFDAVRAEVVQDGLEHPWDIAFAPDGRMLVTERGGRVLVFAGPEPAAQRLSATAMPDVRAELESGLMGIAIHESSVFVCASRDPGGEAGDPWRVEVLRSTLDGDGSLSPFEALELDGEALGGPRHQGCAVEVAGGRLWVTIGDANQPAGENQAQDPGSINGKVLRLELDGSVPADNPFGSAVYSLGHRNPQGIAEAPDGRMLAVEHGTDVNDEINVIVAGGNYGYPCVTGSSDPGPIPDACDTDPNLRPPAGASGSGTRATAGLPFLSGSGGDGWEGDLVVTTLKEEDLRRFSVSGDGPVELERVILDGRFGRLRAAVIGPDGALYLSTANGPGDRIIRVTR